MQTHFNRVLLKLSGEAFAGGAKSLVDLVEMIESCLNLGTQLSIVVGGGNILRGAAAEDLERTEADAAGMLATCINAIFLRSMLRKKGMPTVIMVPPPAPAWAEPAYAAEANRHLEEGKSIIFAGGTGNPYFTTDTAAVLRALEIKAEVLLKGTKVDGVFDCDPMKNGNAKMFNTLTFDEALARNLRVMDSAAFSLAGDNELPVIVFNYREQDALRKVVSGERIGTLVEGGLDG